MTSKNKPAMTAQKMKKIRLGAGFETPKAFADEIDRSERWVQYRESGETPIDRLEAHALKNIARETAENRDKK